MLHNTTFFYYFCVQSIVNEIFYLLDLKFFFYIFDINIGYLLQDVCWLIHGFIYYFVYIVNYKLDKAPFIWY